METLNPGMDDETALVALLDDAHRRLNRYLSERFRYQRHIDLLVLATKAAVDALEQAKPSPVLLAEIKAKLQEALTFAINDRLPNEGEDSIAQRLWSAQAPYTLLSDQPLPTQEYWRRIARQISPRINRIGQDAIEAGLRTWAVDVGVLFTTDQINELRDQIVQAQANYDPSLFVVEDRQDLALIDLALAGHEDKMVERAARSDNDVDGHKLDLRVIELLRALRAKLEPLTGKLGTVILP